MTAQRGQAQLADIDAVDENPSRGDIKEARNEIGDGSLPCSAGADQGQHFAGTHVEVDVVEDLVLAFFVGIREAHTFKPQG